MNSDAEWVEIFNGTTGIGTPFPCNAAANVSFEFEFATGVTAGIFKITSSSDKDYAGAWNEVEIHSFVVDALVAATLYQSPSIPIPGFCRVEVTTNASGGGAPGLIVRAKRYYD